tara:strand:+ start:639 stop:4868 length:4230 start_codon:yes stop_codon:yes gene_type:complete
MITSGYCPRISTIGIHIAGNEDNRQMGVIKVKSHESFQTGEQPIRGGMYDPRMGAIASYYECVTCCNSDKECPGHFGTYDVDTQLVQPIVVEDVIKWLKVVCLKCGTLLVNPSKLKGKLQKLQQAAQSQLVDKKCPKCGEVHPKVKPSDENIFYITIQTATELKTLRPIDIKPIFDKIRNETVIAMGRSLDSHPNKYYVTTIPIPPITTRPYYKNTLTNKSHRTSPTLDFLKHIVRKNKAKGVPDKVDINNLFLNKCFDDMIRGRSQKRGETRTNNVIGGPLTDAILKGMSGKKGLIRNYQMGHRSLNGSRITISGNPRLEVDELGVPLYVIKTLQVAETTREWNIFRLKADILTGSCSRIKKVSTGHEHGINRYSSNDVVLEYGDIVYRNPRKGDMVFFNRPPSLKESAIGAHRAVPFLNQTENTFQINVAVCVNYNADFDGDQMRLKVPRTLRAIAEAKYISCIPRMMLSSQNSKVVNGQVQDSVIGSALMTRDGVVFDKIHAMRTWTNTGLRPPVFDKEHYSGRDIISLLLADTPITYRGKPKFYDKAYAAYIPYKESETKVFIDNGVVKSGILDKAAIGDNSSGSIFHLLALEFGTKIALKKLFSYQQIVLKYLEMRGFTIAFDDLVLPKEARELIDRIVNEQEQKSQLFADEMSRGEVYPQIGMSLTEYYEQQQMAKLSPDPAIFGPILSSLDQEKNGLFQMIMYGSKGKTTNMQSIYGYVGLVTMEGTRMPLTFAPFRSSVYFPRFDITPASRGFVKDCLVEGVSPQLMGFTAQEARQQVVTKSQSTAIAGSQLRKHVKNIENTVVNYYYQTTKSFMLIQYLYGEDGTDPRYLTRQELVTVKLSNYQMKKNYYYKATTSSLQPVFDNEFKQLISDRDKYRNIAFQLESVGLTNDYQTKLFFSIPLESMIFRYSKSKPNDEKELHSMVQIVDKFINDFAYFYMNNIQRTARGFIPEYITSATFAIRMLLRSSLTNVALAKMNKKMLKIMLNEIGIKFTTSLISPGSAVGIMAAQSVGEPMTQAMLDAIHGASSGSKAGLERAKEIVGAKPSSNETNTMWFRLKPEVTTDKVKVTAVAENIKAVKMKDLRPSRQVFLEDYGNPVYPTYAHESKIIKDFEKRNPVMAKQNNNLSRWVIRLQLDKIIMILKSISAERIVEALYALNRNFYIVYTTELDPQVILRIYLKETTFIKETSAEKLVVNTILPSILNCMIRGVPNILDTMVQPITVHHEIDEGVLETTDEHIIRTIGFDYEGISLIADKIGIDRNQIHIGSVIDTFEYYGIEAARARIIEQLVATMEGKEPNYHHLSVYSDIITWTGEVRSIDKAVKLEKDNTLSAASGYSASKTLINSALVGTNEGTTLSIAAPIMLGNIPKVGTNYSNLLINEVFVRENTQSLTDTIMDL